MSPQKGSFSKKCHLPTINFQIIFRLQGISLLVESTIIPQHLIGLIPGRLTARRWTMTIQKGKDPLPTIIFQGQTVKLLGCILKKKKFAAPGTHMSHWACSWTASSTRCASECFAWSWIMGNSTTARKRYSTGGCAVEKNDGEQK